MRPPMGAWTGDWRGRIGDFARRGGHPHLWDYLKAHPGVPLTEIADTIGDAAAVQLQEVALAHCLEQRLMLELIRDLMARSIREHLPKGWATGTDFKHSQAVSIEIFVEPYAALSAEMARLIHVDAPPRGWLPAGGDDEVLRALSQRALAALSPARRSRVELGEVEPQPGDAYRAALEPIWKLISVSAGEAMFLDQFKRAPRQLGDLFAAHWCQSEVRNGGFHQFFQNPTGVLAPEALAAFRAIGMLEAAAVLDEAMRVFAAPWPRAQAERQRVIPGAHHFRTLDTRFFAALRAGADGFEGAADRYALTIR